MVDKYTTSKDGKLWTFTLRPEPQVLRRQRGDRGRRRRLDAALDLADSIGRAMTAIAGAEWKAVDANTFTLTLKEPFGLVLEGMAKPSGFPPVVMPERLAKLPTTVAAHRSDGLGPVHLQARRMGAGQQGGVRAQPELRGAQRAAERRSPAARSRTSTASSGSTCPTPTAPSPR